MSDWKQLAHFLYGNGFWYADPIREIQGLSDEDVFWTPDAGSLCILWHVGHIAHRERIHIGHLIQGRPADELIPLEYDVFGPDWVSTDEVRASIGTVQEVLEWVRDVRVKSHECIAALNDADLDQPARGDDAALTIGHWLFLTVTHGGVHLGRIQMLRNMRQGRRDNAC